MRAAVAVVAALALAGCASESDVPTREDFYSIVRSFDGGADLTPERVDDLASGVCDLIAAGGGERVLDVLDVQFTRDEATRIVAGSVLLYCPELA